ncbi:MAG: hypothetical protein HYT98_03125 [Candidatus Sungbacteria bacterium]|nr:hypothetical protein [Candidatus Sungbacteria bacterium]
MKKRTFMMLVAIFLLVPIGSFGQNKPVDICISVIDMQIVPVARIPFFGGQVLVGGRRYQLPDGRIIEIPIPVFPEHMKIGSDGLPLYCGPHKVVK